MTWAEMEADIRSRGAPDGPDCTTNSPCRFCSEIEPICSCGHPFVDHWSANNCVGCTSKEAACLGFSLASWQGGPPRPVAPPEQGQQQADDGAVEAGRSSEKTPSDRAETAPQEATSSSVDGVVEAPPRAFFLSDAPIPPPPAPKVRRVGFDPITCTTGREPPPWQETGEGKAVLARVRDALANAPAAPWSKGALRKAAGVSTGDATRAVAVLGKAGELAQKGGQFGPPGFTGWKVATKEKKGAIAIVAQEGLMEEEVELLDEATDSNRFDGAPIPGEAGMEGATL
jgi:hypothetical protein